MTCKYECDRCHMIIDAREWDAACWDHINGLDYCEGCLEARRREASE